LASRIVVFVVFVLAVLGTPARLAAQASTIEAARHALEKGEGTIGKIPLRGVRFHWDAAAGRYRVLVIAGNLEGGIAVFDSNGKMVSSLPSAEPLSVQLVDLDFDGTAEIITDEVVGRGTGALHQAFHIYRLGATGTVADVWKGDSYLATPTEGPKRGYLRIDPTSSRTPGYAIRHLEVDEPTGRTRSEVLQLINGAVQVLPATARR